MCKEKTISAALNPSSFNMEIEPPALPGIFMRSAMSVFPIANFVKRVVKYKTTVKRKVNAQEAKQ